MMHNLMDKNNYLVLDGAYGTRIEQLCHKLDPILWSAGQVIDDPKLIFDIHREYLHAGANIVTTVSYQMHYSTLHAARKFTMIDSKKLLLKTLELANNARITHKTTSNSTAPSLIAASIGCYGASLADGSEYVGKYDLNVSQLKEFHQNNFCTFASSSLTDVIAFETIPCFDEVKAITSLLSDYSVPNTPPTWLSLACRSENELNSSESLEDTIRYIEDAAGEVEIKGFDFSNDGSISNKCVVDRSHIDCSSNSIPEHKKGHSGLKDLMLGVNCTHPRYVEDILHSMKEYCHKDRLLVAYANRGDEWNSDTHSYVCNSGCNDEQFGQYAVKWYDAGARIIGGCCMTGPNTVTAIRNSLQEHVGV